MDFIVNKEVLSNERQVEVPPLYTELNVEYRDIHLGIQTSIIYVDDRPRDYKRLQRHYLDTLFAIRLPNDREPFAALPPYMKDVSTTLYLGKITFKKDKTRNITPKYIPSKIMESSFDDLNLFQLNEKNPHPLARPPETRTWFSTDGYVVLVEEKDYKYLKNFYFRNPKNIILSKEQIRSYFTWLLQKIQGL